MKNLFIILFFSIVSLEVFGQTFTKSDFIENNWFINVDSEYIAKHDTINLFRVIKFEAKIKQLNETHIAYFYSHQKLNSVNFKAQDSLRILDLHLLQCGFVVDGFDGKWKFNENSQTIFFNSYKSLNASYKIIAKKDERVEIETEFKRDKIEFKADLLTLKLLRIK